MKNPNNTIMNRNDYTLNIYQKDVRRHSGKKLTDSEEKTLIMQAQAGDEKAIQKLMTANLPFVIKIASQYNASDELLKDLIEEGNIGMHKAIGSFDVSLGNQFLTYAEYQIRKAILDFLRDNSPVKIPENEYREMKKRRQQDINEDLFYNRELEDDYNGEAYVSFDSLDRPVWEDDEEVICVGDMLAGDMEDRPDVLAEEASQMDYLMARIGALPQRQAEAVKLNLGLADGWEHPYESIADEMNISRERARQLTEQGLEKLNQQVA